jgi:hypothetical protein
VKKEPVDVSENGHWNGKEFACNLCDKVYKRKHFFIQHLETHTSGNILKCDACDKICRTKRGLEQHKRYTHPNAPELSSKHYKKAIKVETIDLDLEVECQKLFGPRPGQGQDVKPKPKPKTSTAEKDFGYGCKYCEKRFIWKFHLDQHLKTHDSVLCVRESPSTKALQEFREKTFKFKCPDCEERFLRISNLAKHRKQHQHQKDVRSTAPAPGTGTRMIWNLFTANQNPKPFIYKCIFCDVEFRESTQLHLHSRAHALQDQVL